MKKPLVTTVIHSNSELAIIAWVKKTDNNDDDDVVDRQGTSK